MQMFDDLDASATLATGLVPLIQDVYHLIITERGTLANDPEFGFGLTDIILSQYGPDELPAIADQIETTLSEDDRIKTASVSLIVTANEVGLDVNAVANTTPPSGFRLVGPLANLRAEIIADAARLLDG
jgi:hypothetical protein